MIKLIAAMICLALAIAFWPRRSHSADDGWHDIACGELPIKQPESYDGPIQCKRGPINGADAGNGPRQACWGRQYTLLYGRAVKGAEPTAPAVYLAAYLLEANTSHCTLLGMSGKDAERAIRNLSINWGGGRDWMPMRKIEGGTVVQFISKENRRCVGFTKSARKNVSNMSGVYCDPADKVPTSQSYTDDEIRTRVGTAQLND